MQLSSLQHESAQAGIRADRDAGRAAGRLNACMPSALKTAAELAETFEAPTADATYQFAYTLSHVVGDDEAELLNGLQEAPHVVFRAIEYARSQAAQGSLGAMRDVMSGLVNLACIKGQGLVKEHGGFDLMLEARSAASTPD